MSSRQAAHMARKKAEGICTYGGCWDDAEGRVYCKKHSVEDNQRQQRLRLKNLSLSRLLTLIRYHERHLSSLRDELRRREGS
jgi:hypothetical protein